MNARYEVGVDHRREAARALRLAGESTRQIAAKLGIATGTAWNWVADVPFIRPKCVPDECAVEGCARPSKSRGLCGGHYWRLSVHGDVSATSADRMASIHDRLMSHATKTDAGCWLWTASVTSSGYARIKYAGRTHSAHRLLFELTNGPVPAELELDHLCRVRRCVNPAHLEPVTPRENTMRAPTAPAAVNAAKTHCDQGHPFDADNTHIDSRGMRQCRTCRRASSARYRTRKLEAAR